jgi:hypothetical protein
LVLLPLLLSLFVLLLLLPHTRRRSNERRLARLGLAEEETLAAA